VAPEEQVGESVPGIDVADKSKAGMAFMRPEKDSKTITSHVDKFTAALQAAQAIALDNGKKHCHAQTKPAVQPGDTPFDNATGGRVC
jgi:hypothetical protein